LKLANSKQPNLDDDEAQAALRDMEEAHRKAQHVERRETMATEVWGPWVEGFRALHFPVRLDDYKIVFGKRLTIETSPPPQQPTPTSSPLTLVRTPHVVEKLCEFLNANPLMREPDAKLAAEAEGLGFSNRDWWDARRRLPQNKKISGRPKKSATSS
jgi:hypothetical protein